MARREERVGIGLVLDGITDVENAGSLSGLGVRWGRAGSRSRSGNGGTGGLRHGDAIVYKEI